MADFAAKDQSIAAQQSVQASITTVVRDSGWEACILGAKSTGSFVMRARDAGRTAGADYIVWVSQEPDFEGLGYPDGTPEPIGSMVGGSATVQSTLT